MRNLYTYPHLKIRNKERKLLHNNNKNNNEEKS